MPNTLAHLGIHAITTKSVFPWADIKWIYLGAIIPDVPFILKRIIAIILPFVDMLDVRLFAIPQASLLFSLVLAFAFSRFSLRPGRAFLVLGVGVLMHLLIDACQIKWGNGPRFLVPFDWSMTSFNLFWPEDMASHILTATGIAYVVYAFTRPIAQQAADLCMPAGGQLVALAAAVIFYVASPVGLMDMVLRAGGGDVQLIRLEDRTGQPMELDRANYKTVENQHLIELYSGKFVMLQGLPAAIPDHGKISVRGDFTAHNILRANDYHLNYGRFRELASIIGLAVIMIYWLIVLRERAAIWRRASTS